jgi:hypothetical protein
VRRFIGDAHESQVEDGELVTPTFVFDFVFVVFDV